MKILAICPSINPDKLKKMLISYENTRSECVKIIIDNTPNASITKIFNKIFQENAGYDYYFMANDDIIFQTINWDIKLAHKGKISYGNDLFQGQNLCTFPMIDGDIVRALGWLQMPELYHYCGDVVFGFIGKELNILEYVPDVIIKHEWEGCYKRDIHTEDMKKFAQWLSRSYKDINKIKDMLNAPKN